MADHPIQRVTDVRIFRGQRAFQVEQQICTTMPELAPEVPPQTTCEWRRYTAHMPDIWAHQIYRRFHDGVSLEMNRKANDPEPFRTADFWKVAQVMINLSWDVSARLLGYLRDEVKTENFYPGQRLRSAGLGPVGVYSQCLESGALKALRFTYIDRAVTVEVDDPEVLLGFLGKVRCPSRKPAKPVDSRLVAF